LCAGLLVQWNPFLNHTYQVNEMQTSGLDDNQHAYRKKVAIQELEVGMYVQELDRPWAETPFMFQGFPVKNSSEIDMLMELCEYVYIDVERGADAPRVYRKPVSYGRPVAKELLAIANIEHAENVYPDTTDIGDELDTAKNIYEDAHRSVHEMFDVLGSGGMVNILELRETTNRIVDSVLRNPDAFMLLQKLKYKDRYHYSHAINSCALAASFSRHLGLPREELKEIALGALMLDVGILKMPNALLKKQGRLTPAMFKLVRHHVDFGIQFLKNVPEFPRMALEMVASHHERVNGKGYPRGLVGEQIPVSGRIAAIVDCYIAMTGERPYKDQLSEHVAICEIYKWRNIDFNEDLVEQFIQCVGAYPTGTLVELTSGQVGIILSQNRIKRLYPKVLLVLNTDKTHYQEPHTLDLWEYAQKSKGRALDIKRALESDAFGIDPADYYL
jgi:HD-GYP domain-containing protein (c-di-GMP phosphodiesterase class II)